jgi:hypothetical protein
MTTLSRHFYCLEEVVACLGSSCAKRDHDEAAFWLQELIDSGEAGAAITAMVETCIYHCGVHGIAYLQAAAAAFAEPTEESLFTACMSLCRIRGRDYSFIGLHLLNDKGSELYEPFVSVNDWAGTEFSDCSIAILCKLAAAGVESTVPNGFIPPSVITDRQRWIANLGRRARRLLSVPKDAVRIVCRRGRMSHTQSTTAELRQLGRQWKTADFLNNCNAWEEMMEFHGFTEKDNDEAWELFCETAFPDDIPDEWSAADQAKSHGPGLAGHPTVTAARWIRYIMPCNEMGLLDFESSHFIGAAASTVRGRLAESAISNKQLAVNEFWTPAAWLAAIWAEGSCPLSAAFSTRLTL